MTPAKARKKAVLGYLLIIHELGLSSASTWLGLSLILALISFTSASVVTLLLVAHSSRHLMASAYINSS